MKTRDELIKKCEEFAFEMRKKILGMALSADHSRAHLGGGLSITDIVATLYGGVLNIDPNNPGSSDRDRFVLSKGHGALSLYAALNIAGIITDEDLSAFEQNGSDFPAHPVMNRNKGIEFSSGSLGMGLSLGIGVALAAKKNDSKYHVYVLLGNGECNEGAVWEAAIFAAHHKLENLTVIVDDNSMQSDGKSKDILSYDPSAIWNAFGFEVIAVADGHNIALLYDALKKPLIIGKPRVIIAQTIKGKGVSFMENNKDWHHNRLTKEQYQQAMTEICGGESAQ